VDYNPLPYQERAIHLLCTKPGAALFLDPGMGKTAIALAAHCVLKYHGAIDATVVVVPLRPMYLTWPVEVKKWAQFSHLKVSIIHGSPKQRLAAMAEPADIYLINPENVDWLLTTGLAFGTRPNMVVVDESTRFKNARSKRFKALQQLLRWEPIKRCHIMTGTPAPQSIEDLFAQFNLVDGGERLGRFISHFRKQFMLDEEVRIGGGRTVTKWYPKPGSDVAVYERIKDVAMRLQAEDYLSMPAVTYNQIPVVLPIHARKTYERLARDLVAETRSGVLLTAATAAAATMKMRQIVNGWAYAEEGSEFIHNAKVSALCDLVEEQQGTPLLVAVAFVHEVEAIREALATVLPEGTKVPYLGGGVSRGSADSIVEDWNAGRLPVLLAHPTSVAHGLNLQAGGHCVCWFGLTWSLEEHIQFNARVYRQGQTKPVVIHYLVANGTVDVDIAEALANKADVQAAILNRLKEST
jgi:SNF2 family DNA or RNA helicase